MELRKDGLFWYWTAENYSALTSMSIFTSAEIPVTTWGRLDSKGPWKEFATGTQSPGIISRIAAFGARAIICIDWSSLPVYEVVKRGCYENGWKLPPLVYSSFRIFSRSEKDEENNIMKR